MYKGITSKMF